MFLPIGVRVGAYVSLERQSVKANVKLFLAEVLRLRIANDGEKFAITLNAKPIDDKRPNMQSLAELRPKVSQAGVKAIGRITARVGMPTAMASALAVAILRAAVAPMAEAKIYVDKKEMFELDMQIKFKINLLQIAEIAL